MPATRREVLVCLGGLVLALAARPAQSAPAGLVVIVHPGVPVAILDELELEAVFLTLRRFWRGSEPIIPFNLPPQTPHRVEFDRVVLRLSPEQVGRFWLDRRVRGGSPPPRQAPDPPTLVRLIARLEGAIGYAPADAPLSGVRIVARIQNGKVLRP